ncbi:MAG: type II toxin-antitoxin system RelE/ParE family toxin [Gammaproteobacteria bacterium]
MELNWTPSALRDLDVAGNYITHDNPKAAVEMARQIQQAVDYLAVHPALGRSGRLLGTRELVVSGTPFILVYRVRLDLIQIVRVLHHAHKWP